MRAAHGTKLIVDWLDGMLTQTKSIKTSAVEHKMGYTYQEKPKVLGLIKFLLLIKFKQVYGVVKIIKFWITIS